MRELNAYIDHTLLKAEATEADVRRLCEEARQYGFYAVCVSSGRVALCREALEGSGVKIAATVGFPLGSAATGAKAAEAALAVAAGAAEIDMVMDIGAMKEGCGRRLRQDIEAVVAAAAPAIVKVILETCLLTEEEVVRACLLAKEAGAAFVKTSTGFSTGGATARHVRLMRETVGESMGVKASGGIRTRAAALEMIEAGADRIGASASVAIVTGE
ncbi:MAG: deoxyribose-phosphate aldolase [Bacillota bacterium]|nr:deoxyribose-phosphate aldolase [Bacillota bacterium]